jgi:hypothetical protein
VFQKIKADALREAERKKAEQLKESERIRQAKLLEKQMQEEAEARLREMRKHVVILIEWIKQLKAKKSQVFNTVIDAINELDEETLTHLNQQLKLDKLDNDKNPAIHRLISTAQQEDLAFLIFILGTHKLKLDINARSGEGQTVFQHLYKNKTVAKDFLMRLALKRGYVLTYDDEAFFSSIG